MNDTYRLNKGAINRGVDEVLKFKPIKRMVKELTTSPNQTQSESRTGKQVERRPGRKAS